MKTRVIQDEPDGDRPAQAEIDPSGEQRPAKGNPMSGIASLIRKHRLVSFFVLAYALAWWSWPLAALGIFPEVMFTAIGALLAALIVIAVAEGKAGFKDLGSRVIRWRVPWYWYAVALGIPLAVKFAGLGINIGTGDASIDWSGLAWSSFALAFAVRLVNVMDGPAAEEPSFRGFATPRLQATRSPLVSAAILGVLVAGWHLPLAVGENVGYVGIFTTVVITFVYVWLFNRTGGSVLLVLLFHCAQGAPKVTDFGLSTADVERQTWIEAGLWTAVALAVVLLDRSAWRTAPPSAVYPPPEMAPAESVPQPVAAR
jgi:membrane protease YdiL (CAAX protease family)